MAEQTPQTGENLRYYKLLMRPDLARQSSTFCSEKRSLDSLTAATISFVVALVFIPGTSNGDFLLLRKTMEKVSPLLLFMTTSSLLAILRTGAARASTDRLSI
jgi:hypothetical protein